MRRPRTDIRPPFGSLNANSTTIQPFPNTDTDTTNRHSTTTLSPTISPTIQQPLSNPAPTLGNLNPSTTVLQPPDGRFRAWQTSTTQPSFVANPRTISTQPSHIRDPYNLKTVKNVGRYAKNGATAGCLPKSYLFHQRKSSLRGSAFSPVRGFDLPCTGVSLPLYGQDNFPFMGVDVCQQGLSPPNLPRLVRRQ